MSDITSESGNRQSVKQTYPVRGVVWGVLFGLGLAVVAIVTRAIAFSLVPAIVVFIVGVAIGVGWSLFGPAKAAR